MIISFALLIVLQFLWLKDSYEKAYFDLSRESSMIFRSTVFNLRDSLFVQNIEAVHNDTIPPPDFGFNRDSLNVKYSKNDTVADVRILISSNDPLDTSLNFLKPLASSMHRLEKRRSFVIRMGPDTLRLDTLTNHYRKSLATVGIRLPFKVHHIQLQEKMERGPRSMHFLGRWPNDDGPQNAAPYNDTLLTTRVQLNPMHAYAAIFPELRAALLKEITPQILFSLFLTTVIITSFVMMYRSLRTQELLNNAKNDFINNVTHELKTPVATVSVALEALKDFNVLRSSERTAEYINIAQNELSRLTLMTDKILKTSSFEANGITFITEKINLDTIIRKVLVSLQLAFEKQKIRISYSPSGSDFEFMGNEMHFTNVVYNLLDNALKYGGENSGIDITLKSLNKSLELSVRDYGMGIPKEYQKKIFEKFFRVPSGDVHNVKGYGLGLNYVASVIKKFDGKVEVESDPGQGSLFKITLPK